MLNSKSAGMIFGLEHQTKDTALIFFKIFHILRDKALYSNVSASIIRTLYKMELVQ